MELPGKRPQPMRPGKRPQPMRPGKRPTYPRPFVEGRAAEELDRRAASGPPVRQPPPFVRQPPGPYNLTVAEVEAALRQAQLPEAQLRELWPGPLRVLITPQAEEVLARRLPEDRVRDLLYRLIQEQFQRPEAVDRFARWPRPNGAYRIFSPALGGEQRGYLVHLILTEPLALPDGEPEIIVLAAEVEWRP